MAPHIPAPNVQWDNNEKWLHPSEVVTYFALVDLPPTLATCSFPDPDRSAPVGGRRTLLCSVVWHDDAANVSRWAGPGWYFFDDTCWPDKHAAWRRWGRFKTPEAAMRRFTRWANAAPWKGWWIETNIVRIHELFGDDWDGDGILVHSRNDPGEEATVYCVHFANPRKKKKR